MRLILAVAFLSVACHHQAHVAYGPPIQVTPGGTGYGELTSGPPMFAILPSTDVVANTDPVTGGIPIGTDATGTLTVVSSKSATLVQYGTLDHGVCSICKKQGKKSTVTMNGYAACTAVFCTAGLDTYDPDGHLIPKPPAANCNTCTREGRCSNGHVVSQVE